MKLQFINPTPGIFHFTLPNTVPPTLINATFGLTQANTAVTQLSVPPNSAMVGSVSFPITEPNNFIYPFLPNRLSNDYVEGFNTALTTSVEEASNHLYPKVDYLLNTHRPAGHEFRRIVQEILGFELSIVPSQQGKQAGLVFADDTFIPIKQMGDGIRNLAWLVVRLCGAKDRLFLIDEIENDLHPKALKRLLEYILEKSSENQFIITTHNNIVVKYLASHPLTRILELKTTTSEDAFPDTEVMTIENAPAQRLALLRRLGYDLFDFDLWIGYLILEESSAESIINQILIPHFCLSLRGTLRTIAARGWDDVEAELYDFMRLFTFLHTSEPYKERAWVFVDGGKHGQEIVERLQAKYPSWKNEHFRCFEKVDFEFYYPERFQAEVVSLLAVSDEVVKRKRKKDLLLDVLKWAEGNREAAKVEFEKSANEVIVKLREIEAKLNELTSGA